MMRTFKEKQTIQENLYDFPYHYIPQVNEKGAVSRYRFLDWGFEYLCYILHIKDIIESLSPYSVLDVGCGEGRFLGLLSNQIVRKVGVDLSERAIQLYSRKLFIFLTPRAGRK